MMGKQSFKPAYSSDMSLTFKQVFKLKHFGQNLFNNTHVSVPLYPPNVEHMGSESFPSIQDQYLHQLGLYSLTG